MKKLSQLAVAITLLFTATVLAKADPIDPVFHMDDPGVGLPITALNFSLSSNGNGGGFLEFMNESGFDWFGLAVQVTQPTGTIISCSGGPFFSDCLISSIDQGNGLSLFSLNLSSRLKLSGILNGEYFTVNLNDLVNEVQPIDPNGAGGWGPNTNFNVQATDFLQSTKSTTPEPVTWALILAGVLVIGSIKHASRQRSN